jgi:hypothetical protein
MTTLFHAELSEREFSSHLLHVGDLMQWAKAKRLHLRTSPALDGFEFVQAEALLCAIERTMQDLTPAQAVEIVKADPALMADPAISRYPDDIDPITARWLLGANGHQKWRVLLSGAIQSHELTLLDFASKLPIDTAPAQTATTAPVETVEQRRTRYLAWHTEEHRIHPRGALQRVYEREAKQNPKADRANIGKDIEKARGTAKTQKTANGWTAQLVTDGKRKG